MLDVKDSIIAEKILKGMFGLEKENLRVLGDGTLSHTPHPAPGDKHIVRDFSENQIEINTSPHDSCGGAMEELAEHEHELQKKLAALPEREYLWPFSNPPYLTDDSDIPEAIFTGDEAGKTEYRKHLAEVYGRHKMTFSGIHVNYSFSDELLSREAELEGKSLREFKDEFYVDLAAKLMSYGWILVPLTAASPVTDISFEKEGRKGEDIFEGMSSLRCSEYGYWNFFVPVLDYSNIKGYADSIMAYVDSGKLMASTELYYPVRLKPAGVYDVNKLKTEGADHMELRMYDLDPLVPEGLNVMDIRFAKLLMIYLGSKERLLLDENDQMHAVANFKEAARYDLDNVKIVMPGCRVADLKTEALAILDDMATFFKEVRPGRLMLQAVIDFEKKKIEDPSKRYSHQVMDLYGEGYVGKGMELAKSMQEDLDI